jgi:hypothetical protein
VTAIFNSAFTAGPVPPSELQLSVVNGQYVLTWTSGVLQSAPTLNATFGDVTGATSPFTMPTTGTATFYRLRSN